MFNVIINVAEFKFAVTLCVLTVPFVLCISFLFFSPLTFCWIKFFCFVFVFPYSNPFISTIGFLVLPLFHLGLL